MGVGANVLNYPSVNFQLLKFLYIIYDNFKT